MVYGIVAAVLAAVLLARLIGGHSGMRHGDVLIAVMAIAAAAKYLVLVGALDVTVARVVTETATVASFVVGMEMLRAWWSDSRENPRWTWFWRISTGLVMATLQTVTLLSADTLIGVAAKGEQPVFTSATVMTFRYLSLGLWVFILSGVMLLLVTRFARHTSTGAVRESLILVAACEASFALYGVMWFVQGLSDPTALITPWADAALVASRVGAVLIAAAFLRVNLGRIPALRRLSDQRALQSLAPLWRRLHPIDPEGSLIGDLPASTRDLTATDLRVTLWRVMVEIREWLDEIAARLPAGAYSSALHASTTTGANEKLARAAAGQAWINAGLASSADVSDGRDRPPVGADLDEELAQLLLLAKPLGRRGRHATAAAAAAL